MLTSTTHQSKEKGRCNNESYMISYMIVCIYGSCAAGCNKKPVEAVVAQVVSEYSGFFNVVGNPGNPGGSVGSGV